MREISMSTNLIGLVYRWFKGIYYLPTFGVFSRIRFDEIYVYISTD